MRLTRQVKKSNTLTEMENRNYTNKQKIILIPYIKKNTFTYIMKIQLSEVTTSRCSYESAVSKESWYQDGDHCSQPSPGEIVQNVVRKLPWEVHKRIKKQDIQKSFIHCKEESICMNICMYVCVWCVCGVSEFITRGKRSGVKEQVKNSGKKTEKRDRRR